MVMQWLCEPPSVGEFLFPTGCGLVWSPSLAHSLGLVRRCGVVWCLWLSWNLMAVKKGI